MKTPWFVYFLFATLCLAQKSVNVRVNVHGELGPLSHSWTYFGYDEPNYTYTGQGRTLIRELAALSGGPVHIRTHFFLATGNGDASLKFGSTNAYTEDLSGKPVYDWTTVDKILATYIDSNAVPFVEIGFMPKALSSNPEPYSLKWVPGAKNDGYYAGWTYPPKDYSKWAELVYRWVQHSISRFGHTEVEKWDWEVWNEPNIGYWHGTPEEYDKLYDYTADAVKRALPGARIGGPASTGPNGHQAAEFLRQFLQHCANGTNYVTGRHGAPLDFISFHVKGRPRVVGSHVVMGLSDEMKDTQSGFTIVKSFPQFAGLPIILSEADPEGCAACSARVYPQNAYRNGTLYPAYEAAAWKAMLDLERRDSVRLQGILTWAFEFEDQPYFDGFRTLATNGIDKPVLNFFRMAGLLGSTRLQTESTGGVPTETIVERGIPGPDDVDAVAAKGDHRVTVLLWNYRDEDTAGVPVSVRLSVSGIPEAANRVLVRHYRIDQDHSNAYAVWQRFGSPQNPTPAQYAELQRAGQLEMLTSPAWIDRDAATSMEFALPPQALSLVELNW